MSRWLVAAAWLLQSGIAAALTDLNAANQDMLEEIRGIGPTKARAIIEYRNQHGPFQHLDQLLEVKGIGPKTLERIRPQLIVGPAAPARPSAARKARGHRPLDAQVFPP